MVVVVIASKPHVLPPSAVNAAAIIWAANPGMRGGTAIAELVLGRIEPSGRLPISFAEHVGQLPVFYNQLPGQHGTRYADLTQRVPFAFGEGLSYTTVEYADLQVVEPVLGAEDTVRAHVTLHNTGDRPSRETVQVYVRDTVTSVTWATKELKTYRQVDVAPGERVVVDLTLPVADCTLVDANGRRIVEPGKFELLYPDHASLREKIETVAAKVYGADGVDYDLTASRQLDRYERNGFGNLPVCIAKTHLSISSDASLKGAPTGWRLPVREVRASVGAGFIYPICGDMRTMPGLGANPAARRIDLDADGNIVNLS